MCVTSHRLGLAEHGMAPGGLVARVKVRLFKGFRRTHRVDSLVVDRTLNAIIVRSGPGTPMNEPHPNVAEALASLAITHEIIPCDPAFADTAEFCREYGYPLETSANTIIVTSTRGEKVYSACLVQASAKLAARPEALERREEALEDREVELDEQTEDLKQQSEQRQNLDEQLADAKSAIESVARMFTTDQYKQQADAMPAPDGPAAWLAAPDAANQSNENQGPPAEFEQLSDELKERYRILRRLSRKSDAEIIQQLLGNDGSQSANSASQPQPDAKAQSSPEPAAAPNPEPKSNSKSKGKQNGKKAKKGWFS